MKVIKKNNVQKAMKELKTRALACEPYTMCPKCLKGRG
nr:MAG TPA: conotoxin [Caudoviricetes sp.]